MTFQRLKEVANRHRIAIILAFFVSAIVAFPQVYFRIDNNELYEEEWHVIEAIPHSNWSARVREVQDGYPNWGAIYYKENKDDPYLFQPFGSILVAYMGNIFGLDISNTILLSRFVLPFVVFLLIYILAYLLSRDKLLSLAVPSVILFSLPYLSPYDLNLMLQGFSPTNFLEISEPVNSAMIFLPFFGFLIPFWLFYKHGGWKWGTLSAIVLGINYYNYFYTWTYLYAFGVVIVLMLLLEKNWKKAKELIYVFVGGVIVAIPYGINMYNVITHPLYEEVSQRHGVVVSHAPVFIGITSLLAIIIFLIGFPREDKTKYTFSLALLLTPIITLNQQVITGQVLQEAHYHWYFHKPIAALFVMFVLFYLLKKFNLDYLRKIGAVTIIAVSFGIGFFVQAASYVDTREGATGAAFNLEWQKYAPVMDWLSKNAPKDAVVYADRRTSIPLTIYTPQNAFHHISGQLVLSITEERLLDAQNSFYRLDGLDGEEFKEAFERDAAIISADTYGIYYRDTFGTYEAIIEDKGEEIVSNYVATLDTSDEEWFFDLWERYDVEYILWDMSEKPEWSFTQFPYLEEVARYNPMVIYKLDRDYFKVAE